MTNFRVGDEVEAIHLDRLGSPYDDSVSRLRLKTPYRVTGHYPFGSIHLAEVKSSHPEGVWCSTRFRKVQRRDTSLSIETFLTIKPSQFEEPRRVQTPAKETA